MPTSPFLLRLKANYLEKNAWVPPFFLVDYNSLYKDLLFRHGPNLGQKPLYLLGTSIKAISLLQRGLKMSCQCSLNHTPWLPAFWLTWALPWC